MMHYVGYTLLVLAVVSYIFGSRGEQGQVMGTLPAFLVSVFIGFVGLVCLAIHYF